QRGRDTRPAPASRAGRSHVGGRVGARGAGRVRRALDARQAEARAEDHGDRSAAGSVGEDPLGARYTTHATLGAGPPAPPPTSRGLSSGRRSAVACGALAPAPSVMRLVGSLSVWIGEGDVLWSTCS